MAGFAAMHKLYVGGVPLTITEKDFRAIFDCFGKTTEIVFIKDKLTGLRQTAAFVVYSDKAAADAAIAALHNQVLLPGASANLQVRYAQARPTPAPTLQQLLVQQQQQPQQQLSQLLQQLGGGPAAPAAPPGIGGGASAAAAAGADPHAAPGEHKLYVAMLARTSTEEDVRRLFERFGPVMEVHILREKDQFKASRGAGFVKIASREAGELAIATLHQKYKDHGAGGPLQVRWANAGRAHSGGAPQLTAAAALSNAASTLAATNPLAALGLNALAAMGGLGAGGLGAGALGAGALGAGALGAGALGAGALGGGGLGALAPGALTAGLAPPFGGLPPGVMPNVNPLYGGPLSAPLNPLLHSAPPGVGMSALSSVLPSHASLVGSGASGFGAGAGAWSSGRDPAFAATDRLRAGVAAAAAQQQQLQQQQQHDQLLQRLRAEQHQSQPSQQQPQSDAQPHAPERRLLTQQPTPQAQGPVSILSALPGATASVSAAASAAPPIAASASSASALATATAGAVGPAATASTAAVSSAAPATASNGQKPSQAQAQSQAQGQAPDTTPSGVSLPPPLTTSDLAPTPTAINSAAAAALASGLLSPSLAAMLKSPQNTVGVSAGGVVTVNGVAVPPSPSGYDPAAPTLAGSPYPYPAASPVFTPRAVRAKAAVAALAASQKLLDSTLAIDRNRERERERERDHRDPSGSPPALAANSAAAASSFAAAAAAGSLAPAPLTLPPADSPVLPTNRLTVASHTPMSSDTPRAGSFSPPAVATTPLPPAAIAPALPSPVASAIAPAAGAGGVGGGMSSEQLEAEYRQYTMQAKAQEQVRALQAAAAAAPPPPPPHQQALALPGIQLPLTLAGLGAAAAAAAANGQAAQARGPAGSNLFVLHIPDAYGEHDLRQLFSQFGRILSVSVTVDRDTGRHKGYGFVSFETPASAEAAIATLNGMVLGGKRLQVRVKASDSGVAKASPY